jgi:hypothetical protein
MDNKTQHTEGKFKLRGSTSVGGARLGVIAISGKSAKYGRGSGRNTHQNERYFLKYNTVNYAGRFHDDDWLTSPCHAHFLFS